MSDWNFFLAKCLLREFERNELRFQVRKAASELRKVEIAAGGTSIDVAKNCQEDMERLARLRSQIELEMDQLRIRAQELEQQLEMTATQRRGCDIPLNVNSVSTTKTGMMPAHAQPAPSSHSRAPSLMLPSCTLQEPP